MTRPRRIAVVGAGLAGLAAAVTALEHGADVTVYERDARPHGATRDSAGWIWRYRTHQLARAHAPAADPEVQRTIVDGLDDDLAWLLAHGITPLATITSRAQTTGMRVDPQQVSELLVKRVRSAERGRLLAAHAVTSARRGADGSLELAASHDGGEQGWRAFDAVVLAGGGYARDLQRIAAESGAADAAVDAWLLRARHAGDGSAMRAATELGARQVTGRAGECLTRVVIALPEEVLQRATPELLVRMSELHLPGSVVRDAAGQELARQEHDWAGAQVAWQLARTSGRGVLELGSSMLSTMLHAGVRVREVLAQVAELGASVEALADGGYRVPVRAGITHTCCGLVVDRRGAALDAAGRPISGLWAAGCDAAGSGLGGTASGLAQALVLGRSAGAGAAGAEEQLGQSPHPLQHLEDPTR